jgi:hypothetical protein
MAGPLAPDPPHRRDQPVRLGIGEGHVGDRPAYFSRRRLGQPRGRAVARAQPSIGAQRHRVARPSADQRLDQLPDRAAARHLPDIAERREQPVPPRDIVMPAKAETRLHAASIEQTKNDAKHGSACYCGRSRTDRERNMPFTGSCHCGAIRYTVDEELPDKAMQCNCSMCRRKAPLHHFTTPDKFRLEGSREGVATYMFNKHVIQHHFCRTCGTAPFAEGQGPQGPMVEINLRCAHGVDLDALEIERYDGASM